MEVSDAQLARVWRITEAESYYSKRFGATYVASRLISHWANYGTTFQKLFKVKYLVRPSRAIDMPEMKGFMLITNLQIIDQIYDTYEEMVVKTDAVFYCEKNMVKTYWPRI
jgi:hypothetical protein